MEKSEALTDREYKKYAETARRGIKGEAFFEALVVDHAIPHRIARQNDLGIDFLCEWTYGDRPTGLLFSAQVKSTTGRKIKRHVVGKSALNGLVECTLTGAEKVDDKTISYWKGLGLPAFLFYVIEDTSGNGSHLECYHKRYTPLLDGFSDPIDETPTKRFYKVSEGATFLAFAETRYQVGGFARDLIIDYARLWYSKGHIIQLSPRQLGFWPFKHRQTPDQVRWFQEIVGWHREKIQETCDWTASILRRLPAE